MSYHHSDPTREADPHALPNVEVFYHKAGPDIGHDQPTGWYWWACFPGCTPDGDPVGPFGTMEEALADAQDDEE